MGWGHPSDRGEIAGWFQPPVSEHTSHFILKAFFLLKGSEKKPDPISPLQPEPQDTANSKR